MHIQRQRGSLAALRILLSCFLWLLPVFYLVFSLGIVWGIDHHSYEDILRGYGHHFPDAFDPEDMARDCFTPGWYALVRGYAGWWMTGLVLALGGYLFFTRAVWRFLGAFRVESGRALVFLVRTFRQCSGKEKAGLLVLMGGILAYRLYFFLAFPLHPDEACSYLYFVRQGLVITSISYPLTNNHIFFNLVCTVLDKVHVLSPEAVMRLPSIVGDLALFYGIFALVRRWGGWERAMAVVAGTAFCYMISYYAAQGRGYQWQEICTVISAVACWYCFFRKEAGTLAEQEPQEGDGKPGGVVSGKRTGVIRAGYPLLWMASVVGCYISPLYVYHFGGLILLSYYWFWRRGDRAGMVLFTRFILEAGALVLVLYLPLILCSGWHSLSHNAAVQVWASRSEWRSHVWEFTYDLKYLSGYGVPGMYLLFGCILLSFYLWVCGKVRGEFYRYAAGYFVASLVSIVALSIYAKAYPLERAFCFWVLALNIIFVNVCYDGFRHYCGRRSGWVLGVFLGVKILLSMKGLYWERFAVDSREPVRIYRDVEKDMQALEQLHPRSWQIMDPDDFYSMFGRLYLIRRGEGGNVVFSRSEALGDVVFVPDTYEGKWPLKGYTRWADRRATAKGKSLRIYVADRCIKRP